MSRYVAVDESLLGHNCCFGASVIDSTIQTNKHEGDYPRVICECSDLKTAEWIAGALNARQESLQ